MYVCMYVSVHQSVYLARFMRQWVSNLRQWIFPTQALCVPPDKFSSPPTSKMYASDKEKRTKDIQWAHLRPPVSIAQALIHVLQLLFNPIGTDENDTRRMIHITSYRDEGRKIGGLNGTVFQEPHNCKAYVSHYFIHLWHCKQLVKNMINPGTDFIGG